MKNKNKNGMWLLIIYGIATSFVITGMVNQEKWTGLLGLVYLIIASYFLGDYLK